MGHRPSGIRLLQEAGAAGRAPETGAAGEACSVCASGREAARAPSRGRGVPSGPGAGGREDRACPRSCPSGVLGWRWRRSAFRPLGTGCPVSQRLSPEPGCRGASTSSRPPAPRWLGPDRTAGECHVCVVRSESQAGCDGGVSCSGNPETPRPLPSGPWKRRVTGQTRGERCLTGARLRRLLRVFIVTSRALSDALVLKSSAVPGGHRADPACRTHGMALPPWVARGEGLALLQLWRPSVTAGWREAPPAFVTCQCCALMLRG